MELLVLVILAMIIFGPDKLPKLIQDVASFIRKVRQFSDSAKEDIRSELGPEFKDFEFEDLNPKNFARKHLLGNDDFDLDSLRNSFDLRSEMSELTDAVNDIAADPDRPGKPALTSPGTESRNGSDPLSKGDPLAKADPLAKRDGDPLAKVDSPAKSDPLAKAGDGLLAKEQTREEVAAVEPAPPFDPDAT